MRKTNLFLAAALVAATATQIFAAESERPIEQASPSVRIKVGRLLHTARGAPIEPVYRITAAGEPQIIIEGRIVTVPAATLSMSGKKLVTTLTIPELRRMAKR